jgi:cellulose synthase operon protein YhjQ
MTTLLLQGLRGGVGTTALAAAIGDALHSLGQTVLLVELSTANLLGLHFNLPAAEVGGWALALSEGRDWRESGWEVVPGLHLLPYGLATAIQVASQSHPTEILSQNVASLAGHYDWIIFDAGAQQPTPDCDLALCIIEADAACHALLERQHKLHGKSSYYLINHYEPLSQLQRDLRLLWQHSLKATLAPQVLYRDESMGEALAHKMPVTRYNPDSLAAQNALSIAVWCLARLGKRK